MAAVPAFALRAAVRLFVDRERPWPVVAGRLLAALGGLGVGAALVPVALAVVPGSRALAAAPLVMTGMLLSAGLRSRAGTTMAAVGPPAVAMALSAMAALILLPAGLLVGGAGRGFGLAELSGESRRETVRWSPVGLPQREEGLRAHRVLVRRQDGTALWEGFVFGSAVTLHGVSYGGVAIRIRELSNDAPAGGRLYPPARVEVAPLGPATVPPYWAKLQGAWFEAMGLARAEWRSAVLPLVDGQGLPRRATSRLDGAPGP